MSRERKYLTNIFIDLDGPILDVSERHYRVYKNIIKKLNGQPLNKRAYWILKRNKAGLETILKASRIGTKREIFGKLWLNLIEKKSFLIYDKLWPSVKKALAILKNKHRLILITLRKSFPNLKWQLNKLKLENCFDLILCENSNKSDWKVKYKLINQGKGRNSHSCIIGDTEVDILAGKKCKIKTIALLCGIRTKDALAKYNPDYILNSLDGVIKILN